MAAFTARSSAPGSSVRVNAATAYCSPSGSVTTPTSLRTTPIRAPLFAATPVPGPKPSPSRFRVT